MEPMYIYDEVIAELRNSYDRTAEEREQSPVAAWKTEERKYFLRMLQKEGKTSLLEVGAGTGKDSKFFQDNGLRVISTDLSPEMVKLCQAKGLTAYTMDFLHLDFAEGTFDAVYALNCLLHVPGRDMPSVLARIRSLLKAGGLFYLGLYGGLDREGPWPGDHHDPKRFFSYHTDEHLQEIVASFFELLYFRAIPLEREPDVHFQSLVLRRDSLPQR